MNSRELKRRIKDLEQQVKFLQAQLAAALANKVVVVPSPAIAPVIPITPNSPERPYVGDPPNWPYSPTTTCGGIDGRAEAGTPNARMDSVSYRNRQRAIDNINRSACTVA